MKKPARLHLQYLRGDICFLQKTHIRILDRLNGSIYFILTSMREQVDHKHCLWTVLPLYLTQMDNKDIAHKGKWPTFTLFSLFCIVTVHLTWHVGVMDTFNVHKGKQQKLEYAIVSVRIHSLWSWPHFIPQSGMTINQKAKMKSVRFENAATVKKIDFLTPAVINHLGDSEHCT